MDGETKAEVFDNLQKAVEGLPPRDTKDLLIKLFIELWEEKESWKNARIRGQKPSD